MSRLLCVACWCSLLMAVRIYILDLNYLWQLWCFVLEIKPNRQTRKLANQLTHCLKCDFCFSRKKEKFTTLAPSPKLDHMPTSPLPSLPWASPSAWFCIWTFFVCARNLLCPFHKSSLIIWTHIHELFWLTNKSIHFRGSFALSKGKETEDTRSS